MKEFTLIIECNNYFKDYSELFDYLYSLNGVEDVIIVCDDLVNITVNYEDKKINDEIIRLEILSFLELINYPCIQGFDKHPEEKDVICKKITCNNCCEYCHANIIYTLVDTNGIEKVESDFYNNYWHENKEVYTITIYYNPKIISKKKYQKLREEIDVYG